LGALQAALKDAFVLFAEGDQPGTDDTATNVPAPALPTTPADGAAPTTAVNATTQTTTPTQGSHTDMSVSTGKLNPDDLETMSPAEIMAAHKQGRVRPFTQAEKDAKKAKAQDAATTAFNSRQQASR
jgi:hypothetical protein